MNAALRKHYEVPVASNETLEAHITSLRVGLDEVKEDVRELRADNKSLREKVDAIHTNLRDKIDSVNTSLGGQLTKLSDDIADLRGLIADMRGLQKAMLWVIGGVGSLATILMTLGKTLHWF